MTILQKHLLFIPLCFFAFIGVFGGLVWLLWNWLMPTIFGLPVLSFWQSAGLLVLSKLLFGGVGFGMGAHHGGHHHSSCLRNHNELRDRWERMTPEERERIVEMHCSTSETDA